MILCCMHVVVGKLNSWKAHMQMLFLFLITTLKIKLGSLAHTTIQIQYNHLAVNVFMVG